MNHKFTRSLIAVALLAGVGVSAQAVEVTGNVALVSDYLYDGVSQTTNDPALQGSVTMATDSGFYFGFWGSQVDFSTGTHSNVETDWYVGWSGGTDTLEFDVGATVYKYFPSDDDLDYLEYYAGVTTFDTTFKLFKSSGYEPDGTDLNYTRFKITHAFAINDMFSIPLEFTNFTYDEPVLSTGTTNVFTDNYKHYKIGLGATFDSIYLEASYQKTDIDVPVGVDGDIYSSDGNFVLSAMYNFGG